MPRAIKAPDASKKLAVRTRAPGVPVVRPIESGDLMLATLRASPFSAAGWLFEWKYDGFRCLIKKQDDRVELVSRAGNPLNRSFPDIADAVFGIPGNFVMDAELTVDKPTGQSDFERLGKRARTSIASRVRAAALAHPARLYIFDILVVGTRDLRGLPLLERKAYLRDSFDNSDTLVFVNGIADAGEWVFEQVALHDFEGMVAKRMDAPYQRGRSNDWQKVKFADYSRPGALGFGRAKYAS